MLFSVKISNKSNNSVRSSTGSRFRPYIKFQDKPLLCGTITATYSYYFLVNIRESSDSMN